MNNVEELLTRMDRLADGLEHQAETFAQLAAGLSIGGVIAAEQVPLTQVASGITGQGFAQRDSHVAHESVAVVNLGTMRVVVHNGPASGSPPGHGPGIVKVPAGSLICTPLAGNVLSIYGRAGESVFLVRYKQTQPVAAAQVRQAPWFVVPIAGLSLGVAVAQYTAPWGEQAIYGGVTVQETTGPAGTGDVTEATVTDGAGNVLEELALAGRESVGEELSGGRLASGPVLNMTLVKGTLVGSMFVR